MTDPIIKQLEYLQAHKHHNYRRSLPAEKWNEICSVIQDENLSIIKRTAMRLKLFLENETIVILPGRRIQCLRTIETFPDIYTESQWDQIKKTHYIHENGKVCNIACDYSAVLHEGLEGRRNRVISALENKKETDIEFMQIAIELIDAAEAFTDRYADEMIRTGSHEDGINLKHIIRYGANSFLSALQMFRFLHFILWCAGNYHNTVGRFDQYALPFYVSDIEAGRLTRDQALEYLDEFFIIFNYDSDLYVGVQQGDNGQSMVLGGCKPDGTSGINALTQMCLQASLDVRQIDPKINLRVDKDTPLELYVLGSKLTRIGMGFPQYTNDDVVIPGLIKQGYKPEHARDYTTAACWELIIPGYGMDIPNIGAISLAAMVNDAIISGLSKAECLGDLICLTSANIAIELDIIREKVKNIYLEPAPYLSLLMTDALTDGHDISEGALYNNYGIHGTGFSSAVDQLAAVDELIFIAKTIDKERLLSALASNFINDPELRYILRNDAPKLGRDDRAKEIGGMLLDSFAKCFEGLTNERGGIFKGGTGSAMYYLWHGNDLQATADGRNALEMLPANFSPSLFLRDAGVLSVISAFSMDQLKNVINGGPLTIELHDSIFKGGNEAEEDGLFASGLEKVAQLVRLFILQGGHQLQLNAVNTERLREAQIYPERHENLVIRVWGWSGYFVKLDKEYQDQIIARVVFNG